MQKTVIISIGFSTDPVMKLLASIPLDRSTRIYLIAPEPVSPGTMRVYTTVKNLVGERVGAIELVTIPPDPLPALARIAELMADDSTYIVSPSGGMRYLVTLLTLVTASLTQKAEIRVISESGEFGDLLIQPEALEILLHGLSSTEWEVLQALAKNPMNESEIAGTINRSEKTVKNAITRLRKAGLVRKVGRRATVYITENGRAILTIEMIRRERLKRP